MVAVEALEEIRQISPGAEVMHEAGREYILLPGLIPPPGRQPSPVDGLLCLGDRDGYPTRLFLSVPLSDRGANWNQYRILDRVWYCWSWNHVSSSQRPAQILAEHLRALR